MSWINAGVGTKMQEKRCGANKTKKEKQQVFPPCNAQALAVQQWLKGDNVAGGTPGEEGQLDRSIWEQTRISMFILLAICAKKVCFLLWYSPFPRSGVRRMRPLWLMQICALQ
jgi:hypothetical protein